MELTKTHLIKLKSDKMKPRDEWSVFLAAQRWYGVQLETKPCDFFPVNDVTIASMQTVITPKDQIEKKGRKMFQ